MSESVAPEGQLALSRIVASPAASVSIDPCSLDSIQVLDSQLLAPVHFSSEYVLVAVPQGSAPRVLQPLLLFLPSPRLHPADT